MGNFIDRLAHPSDATCVFDTIEPDGDGTFDADFVMSPQADTVDQSVGGSPFTVAGSSQQGGYAHTSRGFSSKHVACATTDDGSSFQLVSAERVWYLTFVLAVYGLAFTLKLWSYMSYTRYYFASPKATLITSADNVVYVVALTGGLVSLPAFLLILALYNSCTSDFGGGLQNDGVAFDIAARQEALQRRAGNGFSAIVSPVVEQHGWAAVLRLIFTASTRHEYALSDAERTSVKRHYEYELMKQELRTIHTEQQSNPYFMIPRHEAQRFYRMQQDIDGYEELLASGLVTRTRRAQLVRLTSTAFWIFDVVMTVIDTQVFVSSSSSLIGGITVFFGMSLLWGLVTSILPAWWLYQKFCLRVVQSRYD